MPDLAIDADVRAWAKQWGVDERLVQAVVNSEGDIVRAVRCSFPDVTNRQQALQILCRSLAHAQSDYIRQTAPEAFVDWWANRWAPPNAKNDPTNLNRNWAPNVKALWLKPVTQPT